MGRKPTPEQRERKNARERERYHSLPEERARKNELRKASRATRPEFRRAERAYRLEYDKRPDVVARNRAKQREDYAELSPEELAARQGTTWAYNLHRNYNLTVEGWQQLFDEQGRCCSICKSADPDTRQGWSTDHQPNTRVVRGILCNKCNTRLGKCGDTALGVLLNAEAMLRYLGALKDDEHLTPAKYGCTPPVSVRTLKYLNSPDEPYVKIRSISPETKAKMSAAQRSRRERDANGVLRE